jgi:hypothetical protein
MNMSNVSNINSAVNSLACISYRGVSMNSSIVLLQYTIAGLLSE